MPWRMTMASGRIDSRFLAVSLRLSPFVALLVLEDMVIVSALRRFAAISKDVRVLVLGS